MEHAQLDSQAHEMWASITTVDVLRADVLHQMIARDVPNRNELIANHAVINEIYLEKPQQERESSNEL